MRCHARGALEGRALEEDGRSAKSLILRLAGQVTHPGVTIKGGMRVNA